MGKNGIFREPIIWWSQYCKRDAPFQSCSSLCWFALKKCVELLEVMCTITVSQEYTAGIQAAGADSRMNDQSLDVFCLLDNYLSMWHVHLIISTYKFNMIPYLLCTEYYGHSFPLEPILTQYLSWHYNTTC